jgi:hypothetical protein
MVVVVCVVVTPLMMTDVPHDGQKRALVGMSR